MTYFLTLDLFELIPNRWLCNCVKAQNVQFQLFLILFMKMYLVKSAECIFSKSFLTCYTSKSRFSEWFYWFETGAYVTSWLNLKISTESISSLFAHFLLTSTLKFWPSISLEVGSFWTFSIYLELVPISWLNPKKVNLKWKEWAPLL